MDRIFRLSSESQKHRRSFRTVLASALLEWVLIVMLLVYGLFGYFITKFAHYCELPLPCLLCSRIDHILGSEKVGFYRDMICGKHKLEISSMVYCHFHEKLVDVRGMCESCLFSFATKDKSNAETYRLLVGKLGGEDLSGVDDDSVINDQKTEGLNMKHCCCCNELWTSRRHAQTLLQTKSLGFDDTDPDLPMSREICQDLIDLKKETKSLQPSAESGRKTEVSLDQFGYTELKVTSDAESDIQMSDAEDSRPLISHDPLRDIILDSTPIKPFLSVSEDDLVCDMPVDLKIISPEPSETSHLAQSNIIDPHDDPSVTPASAIGHGLEELNWQEIHSNLDTSASRDPKPLNVFISSPVDGSNIEDGIVKEKVDVNDSKDLEIKESGDVQVLGHGTDKIKELESLQSNTYLNSSKARSEHKDGGLQMPSHLDLGDAYQLAISSKGRQLSGKLAEQLAGKDSPRVSADLKILLSQLSRGSEFLYSDILSPGVSRNLDELKAYDSSTSVGMKLLQNRRSLERNDSKTSLDRNESGVDSLDFSIVSEIEGESELDRLRRQLEHDRKLLIALLKELEEERNASSIAANETMAMIQRLQEEKAALQMEASHDLRMMEEQAEYDMEALDKYNDLVTEKEKEIQDLEAELEYYRTKYPDESLLENVGESTSNACTSDSEKSRGAPNNCNALDENTKIGSQDQLLVIEDERKYISECLINLEKKLSAFCCNKAYSDLTNGDQSEEQGQDLCEPKLFERSQVKIETDEKGIKSEKVGFISTGSHQTLVRRVHSFKKSKSAGAEQGAVMLKEADIVALANEVSCLNERLQALEADKSFIEHSISTLKNGEEGLIQEIVSHLRELRKIGIRRNVKFHPLERLVLY
uniref:GTD-binding domain-containing protein n=2 Tax=Chenopodium quinoa TaxID=63459 RepID=A0A803KPV5_CHEQI